MSPTTSSLLLDTFYTFFGRGKGNRLERWDAITIESAVFRGEKNSLEAIDPQCHVHDTLVRIIYRESKIVRFLFSPSCQDGARVTINTADSRVQPRRFESVSFDRKHRTK